MYVQLYITVGLKEITKGNGEAEAYHLGPRLLRTPAGGGGAVHETTTRQRKGNMGLRESTISKKRKKIGCRRLFAGICSGARAY